MSDDRTSRHRMIPRSSRPGRRLGAASPVFFVLALALGGCEARESVGQETPPSPRAAAVALLGSINADRAASGAVPLERETRIGAAAQAAADAVTDGAEIDSRRLLDLVGSRLDAAGYDSGRLQMAVAQMPGTPEEVVAAWRAGAPATFEALAASDLRDFGFGLGFTGGTPFYVLVAAVSSGERLAEAARGLADKEKVRRRVVDLVNEARREEGLEPYRHDPELDRVAQAHAEDMWRRGYYSHDSLEGQDALDRLRAAGLDDRSVGENIAAGQPTAEEVVEGWLGSPGHRANILHRKFERLGVGIAAGPRPDGSYEIRWVQVFARRR